MFRVCVDWQIYRLGIPRDTFTQIFYLLPFSDRQSVKCLWTFQTIFPLRFNRISHLLRQTHQRRLRYSPELCLSAANYTELSSICGNVTWGGGSSVKQFPLPIIITVSWRTDPETQHKKLWTSSQVKYWHSAEASLIQCTNVGMEHEFSSVKAALFHLQELPLIVLKFCFILQRKILFWLHKRCCAMLVSKHILRELISVSADRSFNAIWDSLSTWTTQLPELLSHLMFSYGRKETEDAEIDIYLLTESPLLIILTVAL